MVTLEKLSDAISEAERFIKKARDAESTLLAIPSYKCGCKDTGAVKRASLDLCASLVELRKPN